jgi:hypothetical protein
MLTLFMADPDAVRLTIADVGRRGCGPYKLLIEHADGELIEYFADLNAALLREGEIEDLVTTARWMDTADWTGGSVGYASRSKRCSGLTASVFCAPDAR